ncbi:hypothetical protein [Mesorhizobium sp. B1-1-6]|uniref:hypothetical protein n=1 Tax=Mesorhizobium sp. B1-1-6 TaxID=2589978 RepID=UPI0011294DC4|nr:hypothetical protein [Mesorhizobium sp. B1-1-6]TPN34793.1 hypothetical protein FJ979_21650 [Mesorhizobium sp. B1-1-6]
MRSTFTVVTPAANYSLLTIEQLRVAAGLTAGDASRDGELTELGARVSADIASACQVRGDGVHVPTLRSETVRETFRQGGCDDMLFLARRFVSDLVSVSDAGTTLITDDTDLDAEAGLLQRICGTRTLVWTRGDAIIEYTAGLTDVPADLAGAAMDLARLRLSTDARDPLVKSESVEIPDVRTVRQDFWVGAIPGSSAGPVPADILAKLSRYINVAVV